jgi:hypothetical protein
MTLGIDGKTARCGGCQLRRLREGTFDIKHKFSSFEYENSCSFGYETSYKTIATASCRAYT